MPKIPKIPAEKEIVKFFGKPVQNLELTYFNINSNPKIGNKNSNTPCCIDYVNQCMSLYPSLVKSYKDRKSKQPNASPLEVADAIFAPVWVNPTSGVQLKYPREFGGDHRVESQFSKIGVYSTNQLFAKYTNGNLCAALASKCKYDESGQVLTETIIDSSVIGHSEIKYVTERGIVGHDPESGTVASDLMRYIAMYDRSRGKSGVTIIGGCFDFLTGYVNISRVIESMVKNLRESVNTDQYKGVNLSSSSIGDIGNSEESVECSLRMARLIAGSILVYDHLCILKNIYNVTKMLQYDLSSSSDLIPIHIDDVIAKYKPVKEYFVMASVLNQIK